MQSQRQINDGYSYLNNARPAPRDDHSGQGDEQRQTKRRLRAALDPELRLAARHKQVCTEQDQVAQQGQNK